MGKTYIYKGKEYKSYYSLEKVMGVKRASIRYRHEILGIPLDEVPKYIAPKPYERFGKKNFKKESVPEAKKDILINKESRKEFEVAVDSWVQKMPKDIISKEIDSRWSKIEIRYSNKQLTNKERDCLRKIFLELLILTAYFKQRKKIVSTKQRYDLLFKINQILQVDFDISKDKIGYFNPKV